MDRNMSYNRDGVLPRLDFRRSLVSGPRPSLRRGRSAGSFPEQRLVIEPTFCHTSKHTIEYEKTAENTTRRTVFLTNFEVFGNVVK